MAKIAAIVFDMDGVLIDAREWHYEALNHALGLFGYSISRFDHLTTYDGLPTRRKLEMLSRERGLPSGLHAFINEMKQIYTQELIQLRCRPTFAHEYALSQLRALGYKLAVASNSIRITVELMMQRSNLDQYLDLQLSNQDVTHAKPHPEIYQAAAQKLGVAPRECLVVEDNQNGVKAARDSGAHVMVVQSPDEVYLASIKAQIQRVERGEP